MLNYFVDVLSSYPQFSLFLAAVGGLRLVVKPTISALRLIVKQTATKSDDELLDSVERSKTYESFLYALDWLTSLQPITK